MKIKFFCDPSHREMIWRVEGDKISYRNTLYDKCFVPSFYKNIKSLKVLIKGAKIIEIPEEEVVFLI